MYAVYCYKNNAVIAQVLSDIMSILTGTTDKTTLSASCVQINTGITSVEPAGWEMHDASAGANLSIIKSLNQDGETYNYYGLKIASGTSLEQYGYEAWNAGTKVSTNQVTTGDLSSWSQSGGGFFYIYATRKNIVILPWTVTGFQYLLGGMEISRLAIPAGWPSFVLNNGLRLASSSVGYSRLPRVKSTVTTGSSTNVTILVHGIGAMDGLDNPQRYRDGEDNIYLAVYRPGAVVDGVGVLLGAAYDIYFTGATSGDSLDEIVYNDKSYVNFGSQYCDVLVPKE